jgi:hypothetical protein
MVSMSIGHHLWITWFQIACEHVPSASDQRARQEAVGAGDDEFAPALVREMQASMIAISSAAHTIDALYGEVRSMVSIPPELAATWTQKRTPRWARICETLKRGCKLGDRTNRWPREFRALYQLRDPLVHHELATRPAVAHPNGLTNVSQEMADYSVENSRLAVDLAGDVILIALRAPVAPDLQAWARSMQHVPATIEALHASSRPA